MSLPGLVDVIIRTKNSEEKMKDCLDAIEKFVPVHNLIIVDGGSTDNTLDIIKRHALFGLTKLYIEPSLSLGESFFYGVEKSNTMFVASIDSDVVVREWWFKELYNKFDSLTGVVEGGTIEHLEMNCPFNGEKNRGYLINAVLRRDAVLSIKPEVLHVREDSYLFKKMNELGLAWLKTGVLLADHYSNPVRYRDGKSYISVRRYKTPKKVIIQAGNADRLIGDWKRIPKNLVNCFVAPVLLMSDLLREYIWYVYGFVRNKRR